MSKNDRKNAAQFGSSVGNKYTSQTGRKEQSASAREEMVKRALASIEKVAAQEAKHPNTLAPELVTIAKEHPNEAFGVVTQEGERMVFLPDAIAKTFINASNRKLQDAMLGTSSLAGDSTPEQEENQRTSGQKRAGFTLTEMIVSIGVIGVLLGIALPAINSARDAARETQWKNNLKQVGLATQNFRAAHNRFPYAVSHEKDAKGILVPHSWVVDLLPYLEQSNLANQYDTKKRPEDQLQSIKEAIIPVLNHPSFRAEAGRMHMGVLSNVGDVATDPQTINNEDITGLAHYIRPAVSQGAADYDVVMPPQRYKDRNGRIQQIAATRVVPDGESNTALIATHTHKEGNRDPWLNHPDGYRSGTIQHITGETFGTTLGASHVTGNRLGSSEVRDNFVAAHVMPHHKPEFITVLFTDGSVRDVPATKPYTEESQQWERTVTKSGGEVNTLPGF